MKQQRHLNKQLSRVKQLSKLLIITLLMSTMLTGCKDKNSEGIIIYDDITKASRDVSIENHEALINELIDCIKGTNTTTIAIEERDILTNAVVNNHYYFNNSVYIQADTYMYRFQLQENSVVAYIKYNLEA